MIRYSKVLDFFLMRVIQEKVRTGGQWDWIFHAMGRPNDFYDILKAEIREKFHLQEWEYNMLYQKVFNDGNITNSLEPTYKGYSLFESGGYYWQAVRDKAKTWARVMEIFALAGGTVLAGIFALLSYVDDTENKNLKRSNLALESIVTQLKAQTDQEISEKQFYQYRYDNLIDSLNKGK